MHCLAGRGWLSYECVERMRFFNIVVFVRALLCVAAVAHAFGSLCAAPARSDYEKAPVLHADEVLGAGFLSGEKFTVRDKVPNVDGANHYCIDSSFGVFEVVGNQLLFQREQEIGALEQMQKLSRGGSFRKLWLNRPLVH